ncbi:MAG: hypothetical protein HZB16_24385 [Armatimonadetes bacterium]|nr:hypothetical protein [Armatimonadota bacterium]
MFRRSALVMTVAAVLGLTSGVLAKLPRDVDEFRDRQTKEATRPEGAAKLWFEAIYCYSKESTRDAGRKMLSLGMVDEKWEKNTYFVDGMRSKPYIFRSYAQGTSPSNSYKMDPDQFALQVVSSEADKFRDGAWRILLQSSGTDKPRPLVLVKGADGLWRVQTYSDIYGDVKPPA